MLAEAVAAAVPAASHVEPRAAQKVVRLNAKTKTEVSNKKVIISPQNGTVAGSTEGRTRSRSCSSRREERTETATEAGVWIRI
jgi:hypothetical protein